MDPVAAKYIGAGLATIGMGGAAIGVGAIFGQFLSGALRNPSAADGQFGRAFIGAALAEGLGVQIGQDLGVGGRRLTHRRPAYRSDRAAPAGRARPGPRL